MAFIAKTLESEFNKRHNMKSHDEEYKEHLSSLPKVEPICLNCKYWGRSGFGNGNNGTCNLSRNQHPMMSSGCGLKTNQLFGCNQFKEKES